MIRMLALLLSAVLLTTTAGDTHADAWQWPVAERRQVLRGFVQPEHEYAAGHRGMKIRAPAGSEVLAPTDGVVLFRGSVAGRGVVTIETASGFVITLEPVASDLVAGTAIARGDTIGTVSTGGPAAAGQLHVGVRLDGQYLDPLPFFGEIPRAVLLPCC